MLTCDILVDKFQDISTKLRTSFRLKINDKENARNNNNPLKRINYLSSPPPN